jgi:hypothetical protein
MDPNTYGSFEELLSDYQTQHGIGIDEPGMYCVAAGGGRLGAANAASDMLARAKALHERNIPQSDQSSDPGEVEITMAETPTASNHSSIACFVAWGDGQLSHYFGGDLDDEFEEEIVDWTSTDGTWVNSKCVTSVKASHHGSHGSFPADMFINFNPENIVISCGTDYGHPRKFPLDQGAESLSFSIKQYYPGWELLYYLWFFNQARKLDKDQDDHRNFDQPLIPTVYPYWFAKKTGAQNSAFVTPPKNKVSLNVFDFQNQYPQYKEAFTTQYQYMVNASPPNIMFDSPMDAYKAAGLTARDQKWNWIASQLAVQWPDLSCVTSSSYPEQSTPNQVYYGATLAGAGRRTDSITFIMIESRYGLLQDGSVRIKYDGKQLEFIKNNYNRATALATEALVKKPGKTQLPKSKILITTSNSSMPIPALTSNLPNDLTVNMQDDDFLNAGCDPDESSEPLSTLIDVSNGEAASPLSGSMVTLSGPRVQINVGDLPPGFYLCSSRATPSSGGGQAIVSTIANDPPLDSFVSAIHDGYLAFNGVLVSDASSAQPLLNTDNFGSWWTQIMGFNNLSATGSQTDITAFFTGLQSDGDLLSFNTASIASAFLAPPSGVTLAPVFDSNTMMLGLDPTSVGGKMHNTSITSLWQLLQLSGTPKFDLSLQLDMSTISGQRNAMWFDPSLNYYAALRLKFSIADFTNLTQFVQNLGLDKILTIQSGSVIGRKVSQWNFSSKQPQTQGSYTSDIAFVAVVTLTNVPGSFNVVIDISDASTIFTISCDSTDSSAPKLLDFLNLLEDLLGSDVGSAVDGIKDLLNDVNPYPRRLVIVVSTGNGASSQISSISLDFEAELGVGQGSGASSPACVVLFTLNWQMYTASSTSSSRLQISGQLWTGISNS